MPFLDEVQINVRSGDGGSGRTSFRREKYVPKGGPDGGDGGKGGDIVIVADRRLSSLESLLAKRTFRAKHGGPGEAGRRHGRNGKDLRIVVPVGTLVRDAERGHVLRDLDRDGAELIVATGGNGGRGNSRFATSTDRTPSRSEPGQPGEGRDIILELKLIADVGLVGFPNAGKSTLLHALSGAQPKIGAYPFTTLTPNLGILEVDYEPYVVADVPGLIEGAHQGRGLGDQFLRHVERTRVLLHVVDASAETDPLKAWRAVRDEIEAYGDALAAKPEVVVLNKIDVVEDRTAIMRGLAAAGVEAYLVSALTGEGAGELIAAIVARVREATVSDPAAD